MKIWIHRLRTMLGGYVQMALLRRFKSRTTMTITLTLCHNNDTSVELIEDWITRRICGFKNDNNDDDWIVKNPIFVIDETTVPEDEAGE